MLAMIGCGKSAPSGPVWVDELDLDGYVGKTLHVHGFVVPGSIQYKVVEQTVRTSFVVERRGKRLRIFSSGPMPDSLTDHAEMLVDGSLAAIDHGKAVAAGVTLVADERYELDATDVAGGCFPPRPTAPSWCEPHAAAP
jgi:cytochrome c-type biogenesis protein CcmE